MSEREAPAADLRWSDLPVGRLALPSAALDLRHTLDCGQAFRWSAAREPGPAGDDQAGGSGWWHGVVRGRAVRLRLTGDQGGDVLLYQLYPDEGDGPDLLARYFRLEVDLGAVAAELAARDERIQPALRAFPGLRVLAQEPAETLLSFLCSPANAVPRIARSIAALSRRHGRPIARLDGRDYQAFPTAAALAAAPEADFERAGLGWRGPGVRRGAAILAARPADWLDGLAALPYPAARAELWALPGVGPKIADCVCLFALGKDEAVPVDTHVWALARELFAAELAEWPERRSLTRSAYERVLALYQARYGRWAGWAQQYLYHWRRTRLEHRLSSRREPRGRDLGA